ncbi:MAG: hypothetical protein WCZ99_01615 [Candidatus Paceibacterota bacterium]
MSVPSTFSASVFLPSVEEEINASFQNQEALRRSDSLFLAEVARREAAIIAVKKEVQENLAIKEEAKKKERELQEHQAIIYWLECQLDLAWEKEAKLKEELDELL